MAVGTNDMIKQLASLGEHDRVTKDDGEFITRLLISTGMGENTTLLSPKDIETLRRVWHKHFAG